MSKYLCVLIAMLLVLGGGRAEDEEALTSSEEAAEISTTVEERLNGPESSASPAPPSVTVTNVTSTRRPRTKATQLPSTVNYEDPLKSKVCGVCNCTNTLMTFVIDCSDKHLYDKFLDADWPIHSSISFLQVMFDGNSFTEIQQLPSLPINSLSYHNNGIEAIQPTAFKMLSSLEYLDLSRNNLTHESVNRDVFEGYFTEDEYEPIPLKTLRLGYNDIHSLNMDTFDHLPYLETLELNNNPMMVIDLHTAMAISSLKKLKILNLAETQISTLPDGILNTMRRSLKVLILSGNQFGTMPVELQRATGLEHLNLNNNPLTTLNTDSFVNLSDLKFLNISSMSQLTNISAMAFTPLTSLNVLWCSFNPQLNKIHPDAFKRIADSEENFKLSEFHFHGNAITYLPMSLLPWNDLEIIDVGENPYICDCHVGWMIKQLIPMISDKNPEQTMSLICHGPEEHLGHELSSLADDKTVTSNCTDSSGEDGSDGFIYPGRRPGGSSSFSVGLMMVSLFGIFLVIGGIGCMALLAVRKGHLRQMYDQTSGQIVHYIRTPASEKTEEDEQAIIANEFAMSNDP